MGVRRGDKIKASQANRHDENARSSGLISGVDAALSHSKSGLSINPTDVDTIPGQGTGFWGLLAGTGPVYAFQEETPTGESGWTPRAGGNSGSALEIKGITNLDGRYARIYKENSFYRFDYPLHRNIILGCDWGTVSPIEGTIEWTLPPGGNLCSGVVEGAVPGFGPETYTVTLCPYGTVFEYSLEYDETTNRWIGEDFIIAEGEYDEWDDLFGGHYDPVPIRLQVTPMIYCSGGEPHFAYLLWFESYGTSIGNPVPHWGRIGAGSADSLLVLDTPPTTMSADFEVSLSWANGDSDIPVHVEITLP